MGERRMFRTGHRTDHTAPVAPAAEPTVDAQPEGESTLEPVAAERSAMPAPPLRGRPDATLGPGVGFEGTLRFTGAMDIGGTFRGKVLSGEALTIAEGAKVNAEVSCESISVHGAVSGSLVATRLVELHVPAHVTADIVAPSLVIDRGVFFEGQVNMRGSAAAPRPQHDRSKRAAPEPTA